MNTLEYKHKDYFSVGKGGIMRMLLRFVAVLFNCFLMTVGIGICRRNSIPLWIGVSLSAIYFGGQVILALIPIRKIYKSQVTTFILILVTSPLFIGLLWLPLKDTITHNYFWYKDPHSLLSWLVMIFASASVPLLLFLEHRQYKQNVSL